MFVRLVVIIAKVFAALLALGALVFGFVVLEEWLGLGF
jgi:hypothetical protein